MTALLRASRHGGPARAQRSAKVPAPATAAERLCEPKRLSPRDLRRLARFTSIPEKGLTTSIIEHYSTRQAPNTAFRTTDRGSSAPWKAILEPGSRTVFGGPYSGAGASAPDAGDDAGVPSGESGCRRGQTLFRTAPVSTLVGPGRVSLDLAAAAPRGSGDSEDHSEPSGEAPAKTR